MTQKLEEKIDNIMNQVRAFVYTKEDASEDEVRASIETLLQDVEREARNDERVRISQFDRSVVNKFWDKFQNKEFNHSGADTLDMSLISNYIQELVDLKITYDIVSIRDQERLRLLKFIEDRQDKNIAQLYLELSLKWKPDLSNQEQE
jgi:hypothetical protein